MKTVKCPSCGASFDENLPRCPYCGRAHYAGAEKEYREKLNVIKEDLEDLSDTPQEELTKEIRHTGKLVRNVVIATVCILLLAGGIGLWARGCEREDHASEYRWKQEHYAVLDSLYEAEKYREMSDLVGEYLLADDPVYDWKHYELACCILFEDPSYQEAVRLSDEDRAILTRYYETMSEEERAVLNNRYGTEGSK